MRPDHLPAIDADERDALAGWRRFYHWKPGQLKKIKRRHNKRVRRAWKSELRPVSDGAK